MKILAIDTSTKNLCLGLYAEGKIYEYSLGLGRSLSSLLVPTIQRVADAAGLEISDIDLFGCGLGPGSFTGLRIGLATIKGLSIVRNKPVIGVSSLDILAKNAELKGRPIVAAVDARRGLIYCSCYKYEKDILKRKSQYFLLNLEEFIKKFRIKPVILGDAAALYRDKMLASIKGATVLDKDYWQLRTHNLMAIMLQKAKVKQFSSALNVKPIYLYPKECQIRTK
ncbi:MAG: tRNA (adenosine(37)-N6)-threonylcarbamoyltransferase complex dimerization subunit type 1 TsaB [Candidatus Omnitrophica bacterium]|jgi:tRNA threonylcarbamoyl adenosine modification protein YeaZ|nr:tRNA (adenosine(37)-N6)-threonylcarbamoyltransferase complex dimerization subunit type 1 TsaB [Candidatus Omnitrophota bacterium]MDD5661385.1 tRNA (adenosine(37)-N6)-threonylcarbamoyltransferase complex dimerization subunit type 1 TsaB [Candidatus Omnitrophota bacterium]